MTKPPEGRDGASTVAALAVQVSNLRREVDTVAAKVKSLGSTQQEHARVLEDVAELRSQVERILSVLTEEDENPPVTWFWLTMSDEERNEKFSELYDWVETVLRQQYPDYLAGQLRPCWPNHPEARWELAWLYQLWSRAYLTERPALRDAADWHDRWNPGVMLRLGKVMSRCSPACQHQAAYKSGNTPEFA